MILYEGTVSMVVEFAIAFGVVYWLALSIGFVSVRISILGVIHTFRKTLGAIIFSISNNFQASNMPQTTNPKFRSSQWHTEITRQHYARLETRGMSP